MKTASVSREGLSAREPQCLSGGMRICSGRKRHDQLSSENQLVHLEDIQKKRVTERRPVKTELS